MARKKKITASPPAHTHAHVVGFKGRDSSYPIPAAGVHIVKEAGGGLVMAPPPNRLPFPQVGKRLRRKRVA
jgi:hypothetical protein